MIVCRLQEADRYASLHPAFPAALVFLRRPDLARLPLGRLELEGERLYASIERRAGRGQVDSPLEIHRRYIDIQYVSSGHELIGWRPLGLCYDIAQPYDAARDIAFFRDPPTVWTPLPPGFLSILFPEDAHAPLAGDGMLHKVVVKVRVDG